MAAIENIQNGRIKSIRGIVKCKVCKWWQAYVSNVPKGKEMFYPYDGITKQRRTSKCVKCGKKNRFRMTSSWHGHRGRTKPIVFTRADDDTPRDLLITAAQLKNISNELNHTEENGGFTIGTDL